MIDLDVATDDELWERFRAVVKDGEPAWPALLAELEPELLAMARRQKLGRLLAQEDTPREIVTAVFARMHTKDYAAIKRLCAADPPMELRAWLRVLVRRSAIDYMRGTPEFERATPTRPNRWISLATLTSLAPAADPSSLVEQRELVTKTVGEMVERAVAAFRDNLFVAAEAGRHLIRLQFDPRNADRIVSTELLLQDQIGPVRVVAAGPDGALYICNDTALFRLAP